MLDVTVIVCARNAAQTIVPCLQSVQMANPREVILVDGGSSDQTIELAQPHLTSTVRDPGLGLAIARNVGLDVATSTYVAFVGPDNVLPPGSLELMLETLVTGPFSGVSAATRLRPPVTTYVSFALDRYKALRYFAGPRAVIGTPTLFPRNLLLKYRYDPPMTYSDDSDLCTRMSQDGHRLAIADVLVYEIGEDTWQAVLRRWFAYGRSDHEYFFKYSSRWPLRRRIRSLLHPLLAEIIDPVRRQRSLRETLLLLPFLATVCACRYAGWMKARLRESRSPSRH